MGLGTARSAQSRLFRGVSFTNPFTNVGPLVCQCRAVLRVRRGAQSGAERTARAQGCCNDSCNIPTLVGEESGSGDAFEPTTRHRDADVLAVPANSDAARNYLDSARPHRWLGPQAPGSSVLIAASLALWGHVSPAKAATTKAPGASRYCVVTRPFELAQCINRL